MESRRRSNGPAKPSFELVSFDDLLEPNLTTNGLVKGVIGAGALVLVYGEPGCGKTFLVLDLGLSVADGREWFGHRTRRGHRPHSASAGAMR